MKTFLYSHFYEQKHKNKTINFIYHLKNRDENSFMLLFLLDEMLIILKIRSQTSLLSRFLNGKKVTPKNLNFFI